ncbi:MAG: hypothetical protein KJ579_09400 [Verrucomicrobia bacterium]|nr:hypothetical protein [Verrucomicrobiota bacterium]
MKEMTDDIAFAIWRRFFDQLRFDCLACHARGLFHRPLYPLPRPHELPDDMTPDEFRDTISFVYGPTFDFLCRTLLRREGVYIRRLLQVPQTLSNRLACQASRQHSSCFQMPCPGIGSTASAHRRSLRGGRVQTF